MNSQSEGRFPSHPIQGKITTQNPELLALLRENSKSSVEDTRSSHSKTSEGGVNSNNNNSPRKVGNIHMTSDLSAQSNINPIHISDNRDSPERRDPIEAKESTGDPSNSKRFRSPAPNSRRTPPQYATPENDRFQAHQDPAREEGAESLENQLIDSLEYPDYTGKAGKETVSGSKTPTDHTLVGGSDTPPQTQHHRIGVGTPEIHLADSLEEQSESPQSVDPVIERSQLLPEPSLVVGSSEEFARPPTGGVPEPSDDRTVSGNSTVVSPSQKPYSSRRLKGRDSSDRSLLPLENSSSAARIDHRAEDPVELDYHFAQADTAPIRDLLDEDFRTRDNHGEENASSQAGTKARATSSLTWTVPEEDDAPLISRAPQKPVASEQITTIPAKPKMTSSSQPPNRMYADSLTFTQQEEDEYKFVSSRLDDYDEFKDNATYRELDKIALKDDRDVNFNAGRTLYDAPTESMNSPRYEDRNKGGPLRNGHADTNKQYVLKPSSKGPPQNGQEETSPVRLLDGLSLQTNTEEDSDLEMEKTYQKSLQERLAQQAQNDNDLLIPRLNLPEESVEFTRDSLDEEDDDTYRDTERSAYDPYAVHDDGQWVNPPQNPYQSENSAYHPGGYEQYPNSNTNSHPHLPPGNGQRGYANQPRVHPPASYYNDQAFNGYDPGVPIQQLQMYQAPAAQNNDQYYGEAQPDLGPQQPMVYAQQDQYYPAYSENPPEPLERYPTEIEAEYFIELPANQGPYDSDGGQVSPGRKKVDYVERNKQNAFRNRPGKSYSEMKSRQKEVEQIHKENLDFKPRVKKGKNKKGALKPDNGSFPGSSDEGFEQTPGNPEDMWKNRSASLAHQKQGNGSGKKIPKLKKYPSDSGMYAVRPHPTDEAQKPFSSDEQVLQRSALSTGNLSSPGRALTLKPITQEVWTEDGQRISVDINLKLMSPPPAAPGPAPQRQKPIGPVPQDIQSPHGRIHYSPPGRPLPGSPQRQMQFMNTPQYSQNQGHWAVRQPVGRGQAMPQRQQQQPVRGQTGGPPLMGYQRGDPEKFRKHQQNVEQQQQLQQQLLQQQLAKKQQLQQQLQQLQLQAHQIEQEGQGPPYQQPYVDDYMYNNNTDHSYPSPRDQMASDREYYGESPRTTAIMNPYSRIPPITSGTQQKGISRPKEQAEGYMNQFLEKKNRSQQKKDYKVYTIDDYRKMQKEVRLGGLGPDTDSETYKDKAAKKIRQENYAREVMMRNQQQVVTKAKPPHYPKQKENDDILPKFKVAKEYAKHVPKPKVRSRENQYNSYEAAAQMSPVRSNSRTNLTSLSPAPSQTKNIDIIDLEKLHVRHERDKQNVAMIRQNMEIM